MRVLILYPYEYEFSALTIQARLLEKGLKECSHEVVCLYTGHEFSKKIEYSSFNPEVVLGIGFWGNIPSLIHDPISKGFKAIPWFNANGWVANYHETLNSLPLVLVTSNWVKKTYMRDGVNGENIKPVHVGIDANIFHPISKVEKKINSIRKMFNVGDDEIMMLTAGGDVTSKGAQEMFKAIARNKDKLKNLKYVCKSWPSSNTSSWHEKEKSLAKDLGISDKIIFHDEIMPHNYMSYILNACDIYASPSRLEGFGMIQVEAMACGKPVISINEMGPAETILHGKTGFLADVDFELKLDKEIVTKSMGFGEEKYIEFPNPKTFEYRANVEQLADFTLKLYEDKSLRDEMGQAAASHALENFHYKVIAKRMADLIEEFVLKANIKSNGTIR